MGGAFGTGQRCEMGRKTAVRPSSVCLSLARYLGSDIKVGMWACWRKPAPGWIELRARRPILRMIPSAGSPQSKVIPRAEGKKRGTSYLCKWGGKNNAMCLAS